MLPWKLLKRQILPVNQNFSSVYFSLAKFQLVSCNLPLAMIWQMTHTHKLPKLCSDTLNELKLNHKKTEIMLIYSKYHTRPPFSYFSIGNERLTTTAKARSLGLVIDDNMLFDVHVSDICRSSFNQLRNLSKIRKYLTRESSEIAVHAFITSKLDYCNSLLYGCRKTQLKKLQYVQNTAARIVTQTPQFDHITPVLFDLHWLPVNYRIFFNSSASFQIT